MSEGIVFYDPEDISTGDMTILRSGLLDVYNKIAGVRRQTASLNKAVVGSASVNSWTELPGYWQETPMVILSPKKLPTYFTDFQLSPQRFTLSPVVDIVRTGVYKIQPVFTFIASAVSASENPALYLDGYNDDTIIVTGAGNPHPDICTPFYFSPGGNLTVGFNYRISHRYPTQGSSGDEYYMTTNVYLDVSRANGITSHLLTTRSAWSDDAEQSVTTTIDTGSGLCMWRLRRVTVCTSRRNNGNNVLRVFNYLTLLSYSFSFSGSSLSPTDAEVFYLAVGR